MPSCPLGSCFYSAGSILTVVTWRDGTPWKISCYTVCNFNEHNLQVFEYYGHTYLVFVFSAGCESSMQDPMCKTYLHRKNNYKLIIIILISTVSGVYFIHEGRTYANNSNLSLASIGEDQNALICKTDKEDCCGTPPNRVGEFYYHSGVRVPIRKLGQAFYRTRGHQEN